MNDDAISRQAAIDALKGLPTWWADEGGYYGGAQPPMVALLDPEDAVSAIENLPSAQTEIIRCKECRWWDKYGDYDKGYCMAAKHGYWSEHWEINIRRTYKGDFYCADAEPKEEQDGER